MFDPSKLRLKKKNDKEDRQADSRDKLINMWDQ